MFGVTAVAVWLAALRVAWRWVGGGGWARPVTAMALLATLATAVPVFCRLAGLGTSAWAFAAVALGVAAAAARAAGRAGAPAMPPAPLATAMAAALALSMIVLIARSGLRADPFHLVEAVTWLNEGNPGAVEHVAQQFPPGTYPKVNELVLTWGLGVARSFGPTVVWTVALFATVAASAYGLLRARGADVAPAITSAVATVVVVMHLGGTDSSGTDLPAATWLAATGALALGGHRGPAALAAGLAVGTKLNVAPVALAVLFLAWWPARAQLRREDLAGAAAGLALSLPWPLRNWFEHGSPAWPFSDLLGGDPLPGLLGDLQTSFLAEPFTSARLYLATDLTMALAAGLLVTAAFGVLVASRRRDARVSAGLALGAALQWALSPLTGPLESGQISSHFLRYAMPAYLCALAAVALAVARRGADRERPAPPASSHLAVPAAALAAVALAVGAYVGGERFIDKASTVVTWLGAQPAYERGSHPVSTTTDPDPHLAGRRLAHDIELLRPDATCATVRAAAVRGWLVALRGEHGPEARVAPGEACFPGDQPAYRDRGFAVYSDLARP